MRELVTSLAAARRAFGPGPARLKLRLLAGGARRTSMPSRLLRAWHDEVIFCAAYPDNPEVRAAAERELSRLARLVANRPLDKLGGLVNSGLAGTAVEGSFSPDLLHWLVGQPELEVAVDWDGSGAGESLEELLPLLALSPEADGLLDPALTTEQWVRTATGSQGSPLRWILQRLKALDLSPAIADRLLSAHNLSVRWRLGRHSRTLTRFPPRPVFYQRDELRRQIVLGEVLRRPLPPPIGLDKPATSALIDIARGTLAARARETDPVTYANPREVTLFRLERGVDVALFGLQPARRLPIESYVGFVAARNRIPIAYGGGWVFFNRCEIGVNLFEEFRGGESALIFSQVLRAYRQRFRVSQFLVAPYQFGLDNTEAIRSGAFWFYYRLGFRPTDARLHRLADAEFALLQRRKDRTSARVLRRLTGSMLFLDVPGAEEGAPAPGPGEWRPVAPDLAKVSSALTARLGQKFGGDRERAGQESRRRLVRLLGAPDPETWSPDAQEWFERLAPLMAALPGLDHWPPSARQALHRAIRAKGGTRERDYILKLQALPRLRRALER